ncbi:MAG TPA: hypothetical protein PK089_00560 [Methanoregulaceae archaeon]|nr:hypothetical protein [Methanoregulaceae archaeon]HOV67304.1 hypothetical protein [Methanoregulaceae archaeon]HQJ88074.1 hypothetical protein [Methanoregulaceae archaeon]
MDDATKERFKWKFYKLTVLLNVVILVYALSVMALFMGGAFALPLFAGLGIAASVLAIVFLRMYRREKAWLMAQP